MYNHEAIYRAYSNAKKIDDSFGAFDADGNQIVLDQTLVDAAAAELAANVLLPNTNVIANRSTRLCRSS